jgi:hypothetical protein
MTDKEEICVKCGKPAAAYYCEDIEKDDDRVYLCKEHAEEKEEKGDYVMYWLAPKCPECHARMDTVHVERAEGLIWEEESKQFKDNGQGSGEVVCGNCGKTIGGYGQQNWGFWPDTDDGGAI